MGKSKSSKGNDLDGNALIIGKMPKKKEAFLNLRNELLAKNECIDCIFHVQNMKDPDQAAQPQPREYKGKHWEYRPGVDKGGVDINSVVPNRCFYLYGEAIGDIQQACKDFVQTLMNTSEGKL
jgi:hypothetical protein